MLSSQLGWADFWSLGDTYHIMELWIGRTSNTQILKTPVQQGLMKMYHLYFFNSRVIHKQEFKLVYNRFWFIRLAEGFRSFLRWLTYDICVSAWNYPPWYPSYFNYCFNKHIIQILLSNVVNNFWIFNYMWDKFMMRIWMLNYKTNCLKVA